MKQSIRMTLITSMLIFSSAGLFAQRANYQRGPGREGFDRTGRVAGVGQSCLINALPSEELSQDEMDALVWMREEEKLARDVYLALHALHGLPVFWRIASSEQRHMDAVAILLDKYGLEDPVLNDQGKFTNPNLGQLYLDLVAAGEASVEDALYVGATIEDLDIFDLKRVLELVDNQDITIVFNNLMSGSMNHLRAFVRFLDPAEYEARYLSPEELEEILNTPRVRGRHTARNREAGECLADNDSINGRGENNENCRRQGGPGN